MFINIHFYIGKLDCGKERTQVLFLATSLSTFNALIKYRFPMKLYEIFLVGSNTNDLGIPHHFAGATLIMNQRQLAF